MARIDYDVAVTTLDGQPTSLRPYQGKVVLIVNTASRCGLTPQYAGLEALWKRHAEEGLVVLGFPCDQFAHQEPGDEAEISSFCTRNYGVSFPMFSKIKVNGRDTHPLFAQLKAGARGLMGSQLITWNFTKFLVDREGNILARYAPKTPPEAIEADIRKALAGG